MRAERAVEAVALTAGAGEAASGAAVLAEVAGGPLPAAGAGTGAGCAERRARRRGRRSSSSWHLRRLVAVVPDSRADADDGDRSAMYQYCTARPISNTTPIAVPQPPRQLSFFWVTTIVWLSGMVVQIPLVSALAHD